MTATELPGWTAYLNKHAFVEAAELCQLSFEEANTTRVDPIWYMVGRNDQPLFAIVKYLESLQMNNNIHSEQWSTNVLDIAWPTTCTTVCPNDFYSYSRWIEEKGRHIIYQDNAL